MAPYQIVLILICVFLSSCTQKETKSITSNSSSEISFYTTDSIQIFGDLHISDKHATTILLFHQGGSNAKGEYRTIIPQLIDKGYNLLSIDQRVGGQIYGNYNRTVANIPVNSFDNNYTYCDAYNNLEGALDFALTQSFSGPIVLWGSSYSASLAIQLAAKRSKDVHGVLSFSPASGKSMSECLPTPYFETLKLPLLVLRPPNELAIESAKTQFELVKKYGHATHAAKYGVHGSSMLVEERVGEPVADNWTAVISFIESIKKI